MADNSLILASGEILKAIGNVGLWLQALGIIIILWLVFQIISFLMNRKRMEEIYKIKGDMLRIEDKIDNIIRNMRRGKSR